MPGAVELEGTVELTARGIKALEEYRAQTGKSRLKIRSPVSSSGARSDSRGKKDGKITIVGDSTDGMTSLICGIDTLPLEMSGMGGIYYCIYCGQTFHEYCIKEYIKYSPGCPNPLCPSAELGLSFNFKELK